MKYYFLSVIILSAVALLAACSGAQAAVESAAIEQAVHESETEADQTAAIEPSAIGDPERGREIFHEGTAIAKTTCDKCHTLDGTDGDPRFPAPSMLGISERAGGRLADLDAVAYLRQSILDPGAFIVEGFEDGMDKGYKYSLSDDEVNDLVAFLLTQ